MGAESVLQKEVLNIIRPHLARTIRINGASLKGAAGYPVRSYTLYCKGEKKEYKEERLPDIIGIAMNGKWVALEIKDPNRKIDAAKREREAKQKRFIDIVNALGGIGRIIESTEDATNLVKLLEVSYE